MNIRTKIALALLLPTLAVAAPHPPPQLAESHTYTFEEPGWQLTGRAEISKEAGWGVFPETLILPGQRGLSVGSEAQHRLFPASYGKTYRITAWVNGDGVKDLTYLSFNAYDANGFGGINLGWFFRSQIGPGWQRVPLGVVDWTNTLGTPS